MLTRANFACYDRIAPVYERRDCDLIVKWYCSRACIYELETRKEDWYMFSSIARDLYKVQQLSKVISAETKETGKSDIFRFRRFSVDVVKIVVSFSRLALYPSLSRPLAMKWLHCTRLILNLYKRVRTRVRAVCNRKLTYVCCPIMLLVANLPDQATRWYSKSQTTTITQPSLELSVVTF